MFLLMESVRKVTATVQSTYDGIPIGILKTGHVTADNIQVVIEQPFREFLTLQAKYRPSRHPCKVGVNDLVMIMLFIFGDD